MAKQRRNVVSLVVETAVSLVRAVLVGLAAVEGHVWQPAHLANLDIPRLQGLGCVVAGLLLGSRGSTKEQVSKVRFVVGWPLEDPVAASGGPRAS